ncbi:hypothetical protein Mapa_001122 [Marchantia paleacea]|nr:hypothetical protein Mapa_001122 [Marchantia paleacea]
MQLSPAWKNLPVTNNSSRTRELSTAGIRIVLEPKLMETSWRWFQLLLTANSTGNSLRLSGRKDPVAFALRCQGLTSSSAALELFHPQSGI